MTYHVGLDMAACKECGYEERRAFYWAYTSRMSEAWCSAGADLRRFDGQRAEDCSAVLSIAIDRMVAEKPSYQKQFDHLAGRNSIHDLIHSLQELLRAMQKYPNAKVSVCE